MNNERDPNGFDPHKPGAKLDAGKPRIGLMFKGFARALIRVAEVTTYGANKYTPDGWQTVPDGEARYLDAQCRHMLKGFIEECDADTDIEHMAHDAWNALAKLELALRRKEAKPDAAPEPGTLEHFGRLLAESAKPSKFTITGAASRADECGLGARLKDDML